MVLTAVILAAGRGRRLAPLTDARPKCLLPVAGRAILDRQIDGLLRTGASAISVVVGHEADSVEAHLADHPRIRTVRNRRYATADNLVSCAAARGCFTGDATLLINGDTLFEDMVIADLLAAEPVPILIAIDRKPHYDADDMKVSTTTSRLRRIGKDLQDCDGEAIGISLLRGDGRRLFLDVLDARLAAPGGTHALYPEALDALAVRDRVAVCSITGRRWIEIDTPDDLAAAQALSWP